MASQSSSRYAWRAPGVTAGLLEVGRWRFLLKLLVQKEVRVRYRGSVLGMLWSYAKPAVQLVVYYLAMGRFLGLGRAIPGYVIYLFAGMVMVNFFSEIMTNTTRSVINNSSLVGKIALPRELFPVSNLWVAFVHVVPQIVVLIVGALIYGWRPGLLNIAAALAGILLIAVFALGLGLMFAAFNVYFRDAENFVDLILMVAIWLSPVFYQWKMVADNVPAWLYYIYYSNPLAVGVELFHAGFWAPTSAVNELGASLGELMPTDFGIMILVASGLAIAVLFIGQTIFHRLEYKFAEEL